MGLTITQKEMNGVEVMHAEGRIALGEESNQLRQKIRELVGAGKTKVVLDLSEVNYVDSAGLGTLVASFESVRSQGGVLKLANPDQKLCEMLQLNKLFKVLTVCATVEDAIAGSWPEQG